MATAVKANYGYEKTIAGDTTTIEIRNNNRQKKSAVIISCIFLLVVVNPIILLVYSDGRHGNAPLLMFLFTAVIATYWYFSVKAPKATSVTMNKTDIAFDGRTYAKQDISEILIRSPTLNTVVARSAMEMQFKEANQQAYAALRYAVTFVYGSQTVVISDRLTEPQANRVGSEIATWLAA